MFSVKVKVPAPAACVNAPVWLMPPLAVIFKAPEPTEDVPSDKLLPLTSETVLLPVLFKETAPTKLFPLCVNIRLLLPPLKLEVKLDVPLTVRAAFCAMEPPLLMVAARLPPIVELPKSRLPLLLMLTSLLPVLDSDTTPEKLLFSVSVIPKLPVLKLAVPGTMMAALCVIAPFAITDKLPLFVKVRAEAGKVTPALLKSIVKLRKAVRSAKLVGRLALPLVLLRLKS